MAYTLLDGREEGREGKAETIKSTSVQGDVTLEDFIISSLWVTRRGVCDGIKMESRVEHSLQELMKESGILSD